MEVQFFIFVGLSGDHGSEKFLEAVSSDTLAQEVVMLVQILVNFGSLA